MERTWTPTAAGVLDILAGLSALFGCLTLGLLGTLAHGPISHVRHGCAPDFVAWLPLTFLSLIAFFLFVIGIVAVIGGVFAVQRRHWGWSLIGSIAAVLSFFPLGIPAIILTIMAEKEFTRS
jgi:hypothetical protein